MREIRWYRAAFAIPVIVPILALAVWFPLTRIPDPNDFVLALGSVVLVLAASGVYGGPPYVLLALGMLTVLWRRPVEHYRVAFAIAPLVFVPVMFGWLLIAHALGGAGRMHGGTAVLFLLIGMAFGAVYSGIILAVGRKLRRCQEVR